MTIQVGDLIRVSGDAEGVHGHVGDVLEVREGVLLVLVDGLDAPILLLPSRAEVIA